MKVGFIGLGMMGSGVCRNIAAKGYDVIVYDMKPEARESFRGVAKIAADADELFLRSDVILMSLPGSVQVEATTNRFLELGVKGKAVIDISTSFPLSSRAIYEKFKAAGGEFADASLTGSPQQAKDGTLIVTFGGDRETFEKYYDLVSTFASNFQYIGGSGAGNIAKLANNYLAIMYAALYSEIFPLVEKLDIDVENLYNIIGQSGVGCGMYRGAGRKVALKTYEYGFALQLALKDLTYVKQLYDAYESPSPILDGAMTAFRTAKIKGLGPKDISELARLQRENLKLD